MCSDKSRGPTTICHLPSCNKPVWQDPDGSYSSYCSRGHQERMVAGGLSTRGNCKNCKARPVYIQNGHAHDFCGLRCATAYSTAGSVPSNLLETLSLDDNTTCRLNGCSRPVYVDSGGGPSNYCSNDHRRNAIHSGQVDACLACKEWPKVIFNGKTSDFCSKRCADNVLRTTPMLLNVGKTDTVYQDVANQFRDGWKHSTSIPRVVMVWKIYNNKQHTDSFERYKLSVERRTGIPGGNSRRRWHGTIRRCTLGESTSQTLCSDPACSMCGIIRSSFQLIRFRQRTNFGRFGKGIYTSSTSSKADTYQGSPASQYQALLLNDVVIGKTIKMTVGNTELTAPPRGYDSVTGEPGGDLQYDECIVYKKEAIRPLFLVLYKI